MHSIRFRLRVYLVVFLSAMVLGVAGFMICEKLSLTDALYFCIVTISTVGYGDVHPTTLAGKFLAMVLIIMGVGTFLGVIANATELMLSNREYRNRMEKLNMVMGAFLSEVGNKLLSEFSLADTGLDEIGSSLNIRGTWSDGDFSAALKAVNGHNPRITMELIDIEALSNLLSEKRNFLLRLLENPILLEHESFTDLLWAVFHLTEELEARRGRTALPDQDLSHLSGDIKRANKLLVCQWLHYMQHLKKKYPYLFSLAVRTNPFNKQADPVISG